MELVDGECLEDLVKRRAFAVEDALKTFASVVEAIAFIHQNGILHRDIKSQNIKLTSRGTVKLLDFGIAKDSTSHSLTQTGGVIGTPSYLAPEQLEGKGASVQTDIWALGILLYEMLTGIEPFKADTIGALCRQITLGSFELPEKINPAIPPQVSKIVARCLKKNVAERYQTADELLRDVRQFSSGAMPSGNTATIFSGLKKSFVFSSKDAPMTDASSDSKQTDGFNFQDTAEDLAFQSAPDGIHQNLPLRKKLPVATIGIVTIISVVLLFSLVGVGVWSTSGADANDSATNSISKTPDAKNAKDDKPIIIQPAKSTEQKRVRVDVDEGSAQIFRNRQPVGATPFDLEAADGERIDITLKRDGFEDKNVQIDVTGRKQVYTFSLKPK